MWDIKQPTNVWEYQYARLEYLRHGLYLIGAKRIKVTEPDDELIIVMDDWLIGESV